MKVMIKRVGEKIKHIRKYNELLYNKEIEKINRNEADMIRLYGRLCSDECRTTIEVADIPEEELIPVKREWTGNASCMTSGGMTGVDLEKGYEETEKANI